MRYARLENSRRLQRVAALLRDGRPRTTLEIIQGARVCAVNSIAAELRANGLNVQCRRDGDLWWYWLEGGHAD
ncbi:hypothetical protein CKO33_02280 [Ectothiorhodospira mobilis]|nr:hypothetical protein [Ectothiorhodospira mobilis]